MLTKQTQYKTQLTTAPQPQLIEFPRSPMFPLLGEAKFPSPPALASTLLQLEACLTAPVSNLHDITAVIRNDVGLTVQLLRLAAREVAEWPEKITPISEIVVHLGLDKLRALVDQTATLPNQFGGNNTYSACERFWMHARLTALVAEERVSPSCGVTSEEAYLAGLLRHLGDLPSLLGWAAGTSIAANSAVLGWQMARAWGFPGTLVDVISGEHGMCRSRESHILLDAAADAEIWASRLEFLAARESTTALTESHTYRMRRN